MKKMLRVETTCYGNRRTDLFQVRTKRTMPQLKFQFTEAQSLTENGWTMVQALRVSDRSTPTKGDESTEQHRETTCGRGYNCHSK
jgi:hypothetical protein